MKRKYTKSLYLTWISISSMGTLAISSSVSSSNNFPPDQASSGPKSWFLLLLLVQIYLYISIYDWKQKQKDFVKAFLHEQLASKNCWIGAVHIGLLRKVTMLSKSHSSSSFGDASRRFRVDLLISISIYFDNKYLQKKSCFLFAINR